MTTVDPAHDASGESARSPAAADPAQTIVLLGPQTRQPTLAAALESAGIEGPVATVTAGWQEREEEVQELQDHIGGRSINLRLHQRSEQAFRADPELLAVHRRRQETLRRLQTYYRLRLDHEMRALAELEEREGDDPVLAQECRSALEAVRDLDAEHLRKVQHVHREFAGQLRLDERPSLRPHRDEIGEILGRSAALAIAGGHVAVLLNRLRLFGVPGLIAGKPVVAWSGGAMVISERLVVYHDSPPEGPGNAGVFEAGLGLCRGVVLLPHAKRRLRLDDRKRVSRLARRLWPASCVAMDEGSRLTLDGGTWSASPGTRRLAKDGGLEELGAP